METIDCSKATSLWPAVPYRHSPGKDSALRTYTMELKICYIPVKRRIENGTWGNLTTVFTEARETWEC